MRHPKGWERDRWCPGMGWSPARVLPAKDLLVVHAGLGRVCCKVVGIAVGSVVAPIWVKSAVQGIEAVRLQAAV